MRNVFVSILAALLASVTCVAKESPKGCPVGTKLNSDPKPLVMYSATWCRACKKMHTFLQEKSIPHEEYDIEKTAKGVKDYRELGGYSVPFFTMGTRRLDGPEPERLEAFYYRGVCLKQ